MISRKKQYANSWFHEKKPHVNQPVHVEEGPDEVGGVDVEDDAVDSWSFNCWGSLICKQNKFVKIIGLKNSKLWKWYYFLKKFYLNPSPVM